MRRFISIFLAFTLAMTLCSCKEYRSDVTREEVISAYEAAGYQVSSGVYETPLESGAVAYVQADHEDGDYIYFTFFANEEDAKACEEEQDHPGVIFLFSVIFGDPSWIRMETYGCIVVSYRDPEFFEPFEQLLTSN